MNCPLSRSLALGIAPLAALFFASALFTDDGAKDWRRMVEEDWLAQERSRQRVLRPVTTRDDARGAVDGVKDGKWGFHTNLDVNPWWQVDLGAPIRLDRVEVYNRCDAASRNDHLLLSVSLDGREWKQIYAHGGPTFYGATDGKPLVVRLPGVEARFVRVHLEGSAYLHLDEVEVYGASNPTLNLALGKPADQSSISPWSDHHVVGEQGLHLPVEQVVRRGRALLADLRSMGVDVAAAERELNAAEQDFGALPSGASAEDRKRVYFRARWAVRRLALSNPLLDFDQMLIVKRVPGSFSHMSDQNYGWWSRPGGGIYLLENVRSGEPTARNLTPNLPPGSALSPDLSYDGKRILFAWCRYYPHVAGLADKQNKANVPEDAFYHLYEMNVDGTGLRRLTHGKYDDFDGRYLPDGSIVFLSTRRGVAVQTDANYAAATLHSDLPDSYVRCGGGPERPVAVYTLHRLNRDRKSIVPLSPFESFEWYPSVAPDGRILYARWDYVDRDNMPYMSLWSTNPDGTNPQIVYGNFTRNPHCIFEARAIPGSRKLIFTASAHHAITGGSLVLLDPDRAVDGPEALQRLTPEVPFPESELWPKSYYNSPWPLSEKYFLCAWSDVGLLGEGSRNVTNGTGIYLGDAFGNLELLHRDPEIACVSPIPLKPRPLPLARSEIAKHGEAQMSRIIVADVYAGMRGVDRGTVSHLRIAGMPAKVQPTMNTPPLGATGDDPGKFVLGTVPVEPDGSAYFLAPPGVPLFFQALDRDGVAVQTMRSLTYTQPGQTLACMGCHEPRNTAPSNVRPLAAARAPSRIVPGPEGSWPLRFDRLVQPVLDAHCVGCHRPGGKAAHLDLGAERAFAVLTTYGSPSLRDQVAAAYRLGRSVPGQGAAQNSALARLLRAGHQGVRLDGASWERLNTWMDMYAQRQGHFSEEQERELAALRQRWAQVLAERAETRTARSR